jgi:hypothetical protein
MLQGIFRIYGTHNQFVRFFVAGCRGTFIAPATAAASSEGPYRHAQAQHYY